MKRFKQYISENPDEVILPDDGSGHEQSLGWPEGVTFGFFQKELLYRYAMTHGAMLRSYYSKNFKQTREGVLEFLKHCVDKWNKLKGKGSIELKNMTKNIYNDFVKWIDDIENDFPKIKSIENKRQLYLELTDDIHQKIFSMSRVVMDMPGRFWDKEKVISFWIYPKNIKEFDRFVRGMKAIRINVTDDWYIDLGNYESDGITVKDYKQSKEVKKVNFDLAKIHVMPAQAKKLFLANVRGFGSDKQAKIAKKAGFNSYAEYNAFTQQETFMSIKDYKEYLNEKI